jgi:hypothetical protein
VGVDANGDTVVAVQSAVGTDICVTAYGLSGAGRIYAQDYPTGGSTVEVTDLAILGNEAQVVYWDNAGLHLLIADIAGATKIDLPDSDFTWARASSCVAAQLSPALGYDYLVEGCATNSFGNEELGMRAFDVNGNPNAAVAQVGPVSNGTAMVMPLGLAMDPATFSSGPQAWIVGQTSPAQGFMAHFTQFGMTAVEDQGNDPSSASLDAIAFAPDGGTFAVLADNLSDVQVRTYRAVQSVDVLPILAAGGQVGAASGHPVPIWPSGAGSGHTLAWADDQTVFFITTDGVFMWRPFGP